MSRILVLTKRSAASGDENDSDQERSHMVASARHFGYSRSSGVAPGRVYFDDVTVFR